MVVPIEIRSRHVLKRAAVELVLGRRFKIARIIGEREVEGTRAQGHQI